ncbi:hypothetical protein WOLCODRAFT_22458 [Wolfiporia cocos MD-104 SS10]|uniref:Uncharacterized protein n=1 Tax=Wolfiporia cocos (strain MD-104) TaxID=742152 RepID=A0A2H3J2V4_WOLCO|nr:hypothetical protein WOLCODRAFT_22458 [Wolfiporia cocos MD-104 SS10]
MPKPISNDLGPDSDNIRVSSSCAAEPDDVSMWNELRVSGHKSSETNLPCNSAHCHIVKPQETSAVAAPETSSSSVRLLVRRPRG